MNINKNLLFQSPPNEDYAKNGIDDLMSGKFYSFNHIFLLSLFILFISYLITI